MLDWLDDIDLRRRTNANLNKGEARNALARTVFFNRLGEIRDRTFENQRHRASGLNLVSASIILWNTVYLGRAADYLRRQGRDIDDALLSHAAPLGWEHISLTGDYLWSDMKLPEDGFRPLRSEEHTSELQSLMRISYAVFCLKKKNKQYDATIQIKHRHTIYI